MGSRHRTSSRVFSTIGAVIPVVVVGATLALVVGCEPDPLGPVSDVEFAQTDGGAAQVFIGAGDMASCSNTHDEDTADLIDSVLAADPDALAFTAGDNVYEDGTAQEYAQCYEPSWGRFKDRTWATIGNHEYNLGNADPTFDYYGDRIGPRDKAYYSLDVGNWHVVMLNSNSTFVPLDAGSPQDQWLRADLAANTKACVLAVFHHPRFYSSNTQGSFTSSRTKPFWDALYEYGADVIINGHQHHYERFAPQDPDGNLDPASGIREFIVGTGGRSVSTRQFQAPNSEIRNDESVYGVLKLTLLDYSYEWEFVPVPGYSFTDSGSGTCTGASGAPIADFTWVENPDRTLTFRDNSSDPNGTIIGWNWDFGDGATSTAQNPTHTYSTAAVYTVMLTVTDNDGLTATSSKSVTAGPQAPVAEFTWNASGLSVDFTDASTDADGTVTGWNWDFGDGATSSAQNPSHSYAVGGSYTVTLTVTDDSGATGMTTQTVNVVTRVGDIIYVTSTGSGSVGGLSFEDEDILAYDSDTDSWSVYFDGSGVGLDGSNDRDVRAFALLANGDILMNLNNATTLPDVGSVDPYDILRFTGSTGLNTTSGTFSIYLRGADVGLAGEEIDAISFAPDGRLVISMSGSFNVPGASGGDEDLIALDAGGTSWSLYFDGSDVDLNDSSDEDVTGVWIDDVTGDIYLSTRRDFSVPGVSGDSSTVFACTPSSLGSATSCSYAPYWVGSEHGLTSNNVIGLHIGKASAPANIPPTAAFEYNCGDLDCEFNDASSDADGRLIGWIWNFGDGFSSTARDVPHIYAAAGSYTVTLTVTDDDGASDTATQIVTVTAPPPPTNQPPTASFSWTANDLTADFTDTSTDSDGSVVGWSWDFGDGATSTSQNPSHTYAAAGSYTVTLTVTDDGGATNTATQSVT
ncbi:MAG: PKD domain-containing protein, partial [Gemmatimonadales bacterium]